MEAFKAVEKEMKTKAFSKEGLSAANKLDPREQKKDEVVTFLGEMIERLGHDIERAEAELDSLLAQVKKSKRDTAKQERASELETTTERHKWHQSRLELLLRAVENDSVEATDVETISDSIKEYIENHQEVDFYEDEGMYDDFNLDEEGGRYGLSADAVEKTQSHDEPAAAESPEPAQPPEAQKKPKAVAEVKEQPTRRTSSQIKSPLPTLATLQTVPSTSTNTVTASKDMKPAPAPPKPTGEPLKYASAAAAAAASDKAGIGIAPLPQATSAIGAPSAVAHTGLLPAHGAPSAKSSASGSPAVTSAQPVQSSTVAGAQTQEKVDSFKSPAASHSSLSAGSPAISNAQAVDSASSRDASSTNGPRPPPGLSAQNHDRDAAATNGFAYDADELEEELVYHLPENVRELFTSYQAARDSALPVSSPEHQRQLATSHASRPDAFDAERPRHYRPQNTAAYTPPHYPQEPLAIFDDPRLYSKIDTDSLFYSFYYRQGSFQQYLAARELKNQSWRFHKQYQTWFQRHEEPKNITEDYEQGTYRFFDYESTWYFPVSHDHYEQHADDPHRMNRRKADFKFAYKFLEDDL